MSTLEASLELVLCGDQVVRAICEADLTSLLILCHGQAIFELFSTHIDQVTQCAIDCSFSFLFPFVFVFRGRSRESIPKCKWWWRIFLVQFFYTL